MKAAFSEVNKASGVDGREIRMEPKADCYLASRTMRNVTEMVDSQSIFALILPGGAANTVALMPLIGSKVIPTVAPVTGATSKHKAFH
jgi:branched-chain amino acid transport system substrate-binding protein